MAYRGLILDFGGVVTTDFYGALSAFCAREGLDPGEFLHVLRDVPEGRAALAAVECGQMPQREYEQVIGRLLGVPDTGLLARALADLKPRPEVVELTREARAAGIRAAALSNSWGTGEYDPYDGWDLEAQFDAVVISDRVGLRKPDPETYLLTASKLGLEPGECVFVDDIEHNLPAARGLGTGTIYFTGTAEGVAEIRQLLGLPG